jgi:hypothetical protein
MHFCNKWKIEQDDSAKETAIFCARKASAEPNYHGLSKCLYDLGVKYPKP